MISFNIKTNRTFTFIRRNAWLLTILVAIGGLFFPKLGLLVIPIILALTIMSLFKGRYWCGNFCPHGSFYDRISLKISLNKKIPSFFKSKWLRLGFFIFFSIMLSKKVIGAFSLFGTAPFLDKLGFGFVSSYLMVLLLGGTISVLFAPRAWCNFCPMGFIQILGHRLGKLFRHIKHTDERISIESIDLCHKCGKCARVCPMQLSPYEEFNELNQFDHEKCIRCSTCVVNCPAQILSLTSEVNAISATTNVDLDGYEQRTVMPAYIANIANLSDDVTEYTFRLNDPKSVLVQAGQFILVKVPEEAAMFRAFSISGYDVEQGEIRVSIKQVPNGYGTTLISQGYAVGDKVELEGPMGRELIVDKKSEELVLVAGGIGITPFLPILQDLKLNPGKVKKVSLIYGVNKEHEFLYEKEFRAIATDYPDFEYIPVVAFEKDYLGTKGFVTDVLKQKDLRTSKIYMCGPKPMVDATMNVFRELDVPTEHIYYESA
jgi:NAD(P)H-flavin reductase/NAD-dependent dihydropyrimidine dehydrogenase PreA subunit